ncbi:MAG: DUF4097 family beta strand repeat-containing protein [Acidobacteriota bacterium]
MSWLYTLVFAGLLFSSQNAPVRVATDTHSNTQITVIRDETERFEQTYPLSANGRVSVSNVNGSIVVKAWDRNEVQLIAVKTGDSKERLADVEIKIDAKPDYISVETNYDSWKNRGDGERWRNGRLQVDYELNVPRGAVLNEIETVNGTVTLSDFSNLTKASAVNGDVRATNLRGTANLSTVNGKVQADFERLESGSKITLETVNGTVNLSIPSDSNATLRADSVNGDITNEFGLPVRKGKYVGRDLYGRLGSGEIQVKVTSVNGPLTIGRNKDGKTASPATNLLQQKGKDDDDDMDDNDNDDDDDSMVVNTVKINKEAQKQVKQAQKESSATIRQAQRQTAAAMKQAQKEMEKVQPELMKIDAEAMKTAADVISSADVQRSIQVGMETAAKVQAQVAASMADLRIPPVPRVEKKSSTIPVKGVPMVTVDAPGCSVKVKGWDRPEVQYTLIKFDTNRNVDKVVSTETHTESSVYIKVNKKSDNSFPGFDWNNLPRTRVEVFVPKRSNLKITTGGEIRLENVSGEINLTGGEESIDVRDSDGKMTLATSCGQVRVIGFNGQLNAKTQQGSVFLEGQFDQLSADAGDGSVVLTLPEDANAGIMSNTDVDADGVKLVKEKDDLWRIGKGGPTYNFDFGDGHLLVRNASGISTN